MATQSYAEIQAQIAELASKAQAMKAEESAAVVARIREDVATYGLTIQDIFGRKAAGAKLKFGAKLKSGPGIGGAKYSNGMGGVYGGRGPHPKWLREALASGKKLEDFAVGAVQAEVSAAVAAPVKKAPAKKGAAKKSSAAKKSAKAAK